MRKASFALCAIAAGNSKQVKSLVDACAVQPLLDILWSAELDIRRNAGWVLASVCSCGERRQIKEIVLRNFIPSMLELLLSEDMRFTILLLNVLDDILRVGASLAEKKNEKGGNAMKNPYALQVEWSDGVEKLKELSRSENYKIREKANYLLEEYFASTKV